MARSDIAAANVMTRFQREFAKEYVREGKFNPFISARQGSIIQINPSLKKTSLPLINALPSGEGVKGRNQLVGNEKPLNNSAFTFTPTHYREGVTIDDEENEKAAFDLFQEARPALMQWTVQLKRDHIINAMAAIQADGTYLNYKDATQAQLNTWNTNNEDYILYGNAFTNYQAGDHAASLATIDTTNDKLTAETLRLAKQKAEEAKRIVHPYQIKADHETYVFFVDSAGFRSLSQDPEIVAANQYALQRGIDNPLFTGGDLIFDGVIIKKIVDEKKFIDGDGTNSVFDGAWGANAASGDGLNDGGNGGSRVGLGLFCGAQAIVFGLGKMPRITRKKEDDYEFSKGVAVTVKHDIRKIFYENKQFGCVSVFYSAAS